MTALTADQVLAQARVIVQDAPLGWLMTSAGSGPIHARVMQPFPVGDDLTLWYGTSPSSRKIADLAQSSLATAGFQSSDGAGYASLTGGVMTIDDLDTRRRLWRREWTAYFPGGPDDGYVVLRLEPRRIEVLDFAHAIAPPPFGAVAAAIERRDDTWHLTP